MLTKTLLLTSLILPLGALAAVAQTTDTTKMAHVQAANELGVLEYCQGKGWTDQAAVDAQKKSISALPASTDTTDAAAAEATGKQGIFSFNGNQTSLSQMASTKNSSEQAICGQLGTSVQKAVASMGSMGSMPAMPGGIAMPSMPNGMAMPAMPGAPAPAANGQ